MSINPDKACPCGSGRKYKYCCLARSVPIPAQNQTALAEIQEDPEPSAGGEVRTNKNKGNGLDTLKQAIYKFHELCLNRYPHIRAYKKLRKTHSEILDAMEIYLEQGKFTHKVDTAMAAQLIESPLSMTNNSQFRLLQASYDMDTYIGEQAFYEMHFYKMAVNANSITEEFLQSNRYRKPEKVAMLQAMHDSVCGFFEIAEIDSQCGYILLREVFNGREYKIVDIGMSMPNGISSNYYIYRRIITVGEISFGTGPVLAFNKNDPFIVRFIKRHKANYHPHGELMRFNELYNQYISDNKRVESVIHTV